MTKTSIVYLFALAILSLPCYGAVISAQESLSGVVCQTGPIQDDEERDSLGPDIERGVKNSQKRQKNSKPDKYARPEKSDKLPDLWDTPSRERRPDAPKEAKKGWQKTVGDILKSGSTEKTTAPANPPARTKRPSGKGSASAKTKGYGPKSHDGILLLDEGKPAKLKPAPSATGKDDNRSDKKFRTVIEYEKDSVWTPEKVKKGANNKGRKRRSHAKENSPKKTRRTSTKKSELPTDEDLLGDPEEKKGDTKPLVDKKAPKQIKDSELEDFMRGKLESEPGLDRLKKQYSAKQLLWLKKYSPNVYKKLMATAKNDGDKRAEKNAKKDDDDQHLPEPRRPWRDSKRAGQASKRFGKNRRLAESSYEKALKFEFSGDYEKAYEQYNKCITYYPNYSDVVSRMLRYQRLMELTEAIINYRKRHPEELSELYHRLAMVMLEKGQLAKETELKQFWLTRSEASLRQSIKIAPNWAPAFYRLGNFIASVKKDYRQAKTYFEKAIELDRDFAVARYGLALLLIDSEEFAESLKHLDALISGGYKVGLCNYYSGLCHESLGRLADAETSLLRAVKSLPDDIPTLAALARIYSAKGWHNEAAKYIKTALENAPEKSRDLFRMMGNCFVGLEDWESALHYFQEAVKLKDAEKDPELHGNLGLCFEHLNKIPHALEEYKLAIAADATYHKAYYNLARLLLQGPKELQDATASLKYALRAAALSYSKKPEYLAILAEAHFRNMQFDNAIEATKKAIALSPSNLKYYYDQLIKFSNAKNGANTGNDE